jgi:hypothetical protein
VFGLGIVLVYGKCDRVVFQVEVQVRVLIIDRVRDRDRVMFP